MKSVNNLNEMISDFLANGGKITRVKDGMPKDLKRIKRSGWQFGGKRIYAITLASRNEKKDIFAGGMITKPQFKGSKMKMCW